MPNIVAAVVVNRNKEATGGSGAGWISALPDNAGTVGLTVCALQKLCLIAI